MWEGISPAVLVQRTVLRSTHGVLPLITGIEVGSLNDTSARETEDAWLQVGKILYKIGTETIPVVFWEERDVVEIYALRTFLQIYSHQTLGIGLRRGQGSCKLLPLVVGDVDDLLGNDIILGINQLHTDLALLAIDEMKTAIYGEIVLHILLQAHTEETTVLQTGLLLTRTGTLESYIMRVAVEGWLHVVEGYVTECIPSHQALWKLERTVFHHLCIETAIGTEVDILEEDTIHGRLDFYSRLVCLNHKLMLCESSERRHRHQHCCENFSFSHIALLLLFCRFVYIPMDNTHNVSEYRCKDTKNPPQMRWIFCLNILDFRSNRYFSTIYPVE